MIKVSGSQSISRDCGGARSSGNIAVSVKDWHQRLPVPVKRESTSLLSTLDGLSR